MDQPFHIGHLYGTVFALETSLPSVLDTITFTDGLPSASTVITQLATVGKEISVQDAELVAASFADLRSHIHGALVAAQRVENALAVLRANGELNLEELVSQANPAAPSAPEPERHQVVHEHLVPETFDMRALNLVLINVGHCNPRPFIRKRLGVPAIWLGDHQVLPGSKLRVTEFWVDNRIDDIVCTVVPPDDAAAAVAPGAQSTRLDTR
uniref:Uncharacterized protein n=1 Tax=viral metagenome TaxID=1070528 RepID=A0A2V0R993_9ZZZZ